VGQHGFSASDATNPSDAAARMSPPSSGAAARRTREVLVVGATPYYWPLMRHGAGAGYSCLYSSFSLPLGVAPTIGIPAGRPIKSLRMPV